MITYSEILFLGAGDLERAEDAWRQVLQLDSNYRDARLRLLETLGHQMVYVPDGEFLMGSEDS